MKTAIDALSQGLSRDETRTGSQRRADALVDMAATQLRCGDHRDVHGQRPHLTLTVSADTLRGDADGWPAELRGVGPIHPETARRIACDAALTVVAVAPPADGVRRGRAAAHRSCRSRSDGKRAPSRHTSAPRSTCATRGVGFRAAIDPPRGPTATTSSTGRTVQQAG